MYCWRQASSGSWSLGFWLFLMEGPTGNFRTLFYKGDDKQARTPSAWLLPDSNKMTIRASGTDYADLGECKEALLGLIGDTVKSHIDGIYRYDQQLGHHGEAVVPFIVGVH